MYIIVDTSPFWFAFTPLVYLHLLSDSKYESALTKHFLFKIILMNPKESGSKHRPEITGKVLHIENLDAETFFRELDSIKNRLDEISQSQTPVKSEEKEYLSRQDVANIFGVTLPTVHAWTKHGILKGKKIANKVYYLKSEVHEALADISNRKEATNV